MSVATAATTESDTSIPRPMSNDFDDRDTTCIRRDGETPDEAGCHCIVCEDWRQEQQTDSLREELERVLREKAASSETDGTQEALDAFVGGDDS